MPIGNRHFGAAGIGPCGTWSCTHCRFQLRPRQIEFAPSRRPAFRQNRKQCPGFARSSYNTTTPETYFVEAKQVGGWKLAPDIGIVQLDRCYSQLVPARLISPAQFDQLQAQSPSRWRYVGYQHVDADRAGPRVHFAPVGLTGNGTSPYQTRSHPGMNVAVGDSGSPVFRDPSPVGAASDWLLLSGVMATTSRNASVPYVRDQIVSILNALPPCPAVDDAADSVK